MNLSKDEEKEELNKSQTNYFNPFYTFYEHQTISKSLIFYINEEISEPKYYTDMIYKISTAGPSDTIYLNLNTPGGCLLTGMQIINAMNISQAKIITSLDVEASSMGAILFLSGDEFRVNPNSVMMIHNYSGGGAGGKGNEQLSQVNAMADWYGKILKDICHPFLSMDEIEEVLNGQDIWLHSEEITMRLTKMVKDLNKKKSQDPKKLTKKPIKSKL